MPKLRIVPKAPWTKAQVAEVLGVSEPTVEKLIRTGRLRAIRVSKSCTRILDEDFQNFLALNATAQRPNSVNASS